MREIEFRAYLKKEHKIVEVKSLHLGTRKIMYGYSETREIYGNTTRSLDECELMQYTGLKDKNGQKIFEGDIFEIEENEAIGVVVFEKGAYRIEIYGYREVLYEYGYDTGSWDYLTTEDFDMYYIDQMEVIGNIYDNPELLEGE